MSLGRTPGLAVEAVAGLHEHDGGFARARRCRMRTRRRSRVRSRGEDLGFTPRIVSLEPEFTLLGGRPHTFAGRPAAAWFYRSRVGGLGARRGVPRAAGGSRTAGRRAAGRRHDAAHLPQDDADHRLLAGRPAGVRRSFRRCRARPSSRWRAGMLPAAARRPTDTGTHHGTETVSLGPARHRPHQSLHHSTTARVVPACAGGRGQPRPGARRGLRPRVGHPAHARAATKR